jgi:hypothetical protein
MCFVRGIDRSFRSNCKVPCLVSTATTRRHPSLWQQNAEARASGVTPPVFIVVCNNTNVSKLVFDFLGGWEKQIGEKKIARTTCHLPKR